MITGHPPPREAKDRGSDVEVLKQIIANGIDTHNRSMRRLNEGTFARRSAVSRSLQGAARICGIRGYAFLAPNCSG